ncbi:MAG: response regulator [Nitrosopumilaceae archaeon]|uniref:Response regulator n=3 Tax=Candidatus Nitrosomaritimum aestuariumsis TaxID=3342354 RepID=A0AC60W543_9ARCH|nr:response regulator [Nitrosopumilaceae archaeon]MBA4454841.1 response regulator [Nitrosopumilaceae archaeon]MBA4462099.1 response regulator [Nitrosopumilaceae archaeon]MBA4463590.1 response regulator [Nitrosopumilaceae archaeon]NCF22125.1 response regulator [Nitrosopumilaceae archaeon]
MIRAVVVDDEKETLQLFSDLLTSNGIKVVGKGYNGQDAVFLYQKLKPDILFLDILMPVHDGIYALKNIRDSHPEAKIIAIYDKLSVGKEIELNRLKPSEIIREPIDVDDILRKTHKLCMPSGDSLDEMKRTMVTLAIKNSLLELGLEEFDKIVMMLQKDYNSTLEDCYDNPEFLKQVLKDLLGDAYNDVLNSLKENINNISSHKSTENFLDALNS